MPSVLFTESMAVEMGAREPWSTDAKLFQPDEQHHLTVSEAANSLSVQAFLRMCKLPYTVEFRYNAEHISPSGSVPVLQCGSFVVSEMDSIVSFVQTKGAQLTQDLNASQRADMKAYISLINTVLVNAELYLTWIEPSGYSVTAKRYDSVYPFPLNRILPWMKRRHIWGCITEWTQKELKHVYDEVQTCLTALSERLGKQSFFFGQQPTELDALVFGHVCTLTETQLPGRSLAAMVGAFENLAQLASRVRQLYFDGQPVVMSSPANSPKRQVPATGGEINEAAELGFAEIEAV